MGIFPDRDSIIRLVGAVLAEQHDEWSEGRCYINLDALTASQKVGLNEDATTNSKEVTGTDPAAIAA